MNCKVPLLHSPDRHRPVIQKLRGLVEQPCRCLRWCGLRYQGTLGLLQGQQPLLSFFPLPQFIVVALGFMVDHIKSKATEQSKPMNKNIPRDMEAWNRLWNFREKAGRGEWLGGKKSANELVCIYT